jgi:hypothetical protein
LPLIRRMTLFPFATVLGHFQTALEDGAYLFVQDQLGAKLSGRSAIAGFHPHGSGRAPLGHPAPLERPASSRRSVPDLMDGRSWERENGQQTIELRPIHLGLLAPSLQRLEPHSPYQFMELIQ